MTPVPFDARLLEELIGAAVAAPSVFNTQPWRFRLDTHSGELEVRAVPGRQLRHLDPSGRALHLSVGAAVYNLRVAASHHGWEPSVRLLPDPRQTDLLAAVRLTGPVPAGSRIRAGLYGAIGSRHSSRFPFSDARPPRAVLTELREAAQDEGATLVLADAGQAAGLMRLTAEAERRNNKDPERREESRRWIREGSGDGLSGAALGVRDAAGRVPVRDHTAGRGTALPAAAYESDPLVAVLVTAHDERADWLGAGQALQNVLLRAARHTVQTSLFHQAVEWPDLRAELLPETARPGFTQMLIRLGYGPLGPGTPRRPVSEVLDNGAG
ncbi:putative NAD(P)H nitroreductase [Streptomyces sp. RB5]|uniref:Putative NAD(P)H nitroreductase n=1 Tax=Streptomyces smaragdinus TaxID=2585196 RepID=A0A7K0CAJ0_9ACTN|nr:hypothetical protein [Streptomyces smaragdinus]MQY10162.1 putative NAD(P)H nitroreductase [Streptomyces smaragdinus]